MHMITTAEKKKWTTRDMAYVGIFAVLIAVCAWISIPTTVPFTMQTFGIFAAVGLLGGRRGSMAVLVYILLGAVGLPVFAGFSGGAGMLLSTTGGYIVGFWASALVYWLITAHMGTRPAVMAMAMVAGLIACYALGTVWFMQVYAQSAGPVGLMTALGWCVFPFVVPDLCKIALALWVSCKLRSHVK